MSELFEAETLFGTQVEINYFAFIVNAFLTAILAGMLGQIYIKFGSTISNRKSFANIFVVLALSTMMIITVIKSSIALSLGLVGALSIVRFRSAIKEPEELVYLFLTIAIGLGIGAEQQTITIILFLITSLIIFIKHKFSSGSGINNKDLIINLIINNNQLENVKKVLQKHCSLLEINRIKKEKEKLEVSVFAELTSADKVELIITDLENLDEKVEVNFLNTKGLLT
jgi:uncharacterized membrane protein YhiD involved in acid resistance